VAAIDALDADLIDDDRSCSFALKGGNNSSSRPSSLDSSQKSMKTMPILNYQSNLSPSNFSPRNKILNQGILRINREVENPRASKNEDKDVDITVTRLFEDSCDGSEKSAASQKTG
jgi:hypothetical protein